MCKYALKFERASNMYNYLFNCSPLISGVIVPREEDQRKRRKAREKSDLETTLLNLEDARYIVTSSTTSSVDR